MHRRIAVFLVAALVALAGCKKDDGPTDTGGGGGTGGGGTGGGGGIGGGGGSAPVADFSTSVSYGYVSFTVQFTDVSSGDPTSWSWDFGDGTTSSLQNPSHVYIRPGKYRVSLTVSNAHGSNAKAKAGCITAYGVITIRHASAYTGSVTVNVDGSDHVILRGGLIRLAVAESTTLSIWECLWINNAWSCRWDGGYVVSPGVRYKVTDGSSTHWDLTLAYD